MPTPTIFEGINPRGTQNFISCKDKAAVAWADAGKSVKKNYYYPLGELLNIASETPIANGINVKSTQAGNWANAGFIVKNPKKSTDFIMSCNIDYVSGINAVTIKTATSLSDYSGTYIAGDQGITSDKNSKFSFNTGTTDYLFIQFTVTNNTGGTGEANFTYIMLRPASIVDDTYEPYIPDNTELLPRSEQAVLGAKNLLDNRGTSEGNITVNEDKTITVNGTFTARTVFYIRTKQTNYVLPKGTYNLFFSDVSNKFNIVVDAYLGDTWVKNISTTKTNSTFSVDYNGYDRLVVFVVIEASELPATFTNVTFKPMITLATDTDSNYAPYAMTNKELTEKIKGVGIIKVLTSTDDLDDLYAEPSGLYYVTSAPANSPEGIANYALLNAIGNSGDGKQIAFKTSGSTGGVMYIRSLGSGSTWAGWYKFTGTAVTP